VHNSHENILVLLDEATHQLRTVSFEDDSTKPGPRLFLESEEKIDGRACVSGSLTLTECHCEEFDLSVRFAKYNKGAQLHFATAPKSFYLLRQLQDALHMVEMASDLVAQLGSVRSSSPPTHTAVQGVVTTVSRPLWLDLLPRIRHIGSPLPIPVFACALVCE